MLERVIIIASATAIVTILSMICDRAQEKAISRAKAKDAKNQNRIYTEFVD